MKLDEVYDPKEDPLTVFSVNDETSDLKFSSVYTDSRTQQILVHEYQLLISVKM